MTDEDDLFRDSKFYRWHLVNTSRDYEQIQRLRTEALKILIESINVGEVTGLDGVDSPLSQQIRTIHGVEQFEMNANWMGSSQLWVCPCCSRSKPEISRVGKKGQILAKPVIHHDHMGQAMKEAFHAAFKSAGTAVEQTHGLKLVDRIGIAFAAFEEVLICEDCNNADAEAKKIVSAPRFFSFSITQIRQFISFEPHRPHVVDAQKAMQAWQLAKAAFDLRMKLIGEIAQAAATDAHWYEPYAGPGEAIPLLGFGYKLSRSVVKEWVSTEALYDALGPKKKVSTPNLSRWRTERKKLGRPLPTNYLAILRSKETCAKAWDAQPEDWHCPVCSRTKFQAAYIADDGGVQFHTASTGGRGAWEPAPYVCNHCRSTMTSLKYEITALLGEKPINSYSYLNPAELSAIIAPRPHSPHLVHGDKAERLIMTIMERLA